MATEIFKQIFHSGTSGSVRTCDCGRTYFDGADTAVDWEDGELEQLQNEAIRTDRCIELDSSVSTLDIECREFVIGCSCNGADKYEQFINQHDRQIAEYLNKKSESLKEISKELEVKPNDNDRG